MREVVIALDADRTTNRDVWDASETLAAHCTAMGIERVRHLTLPAANKAGLDDYLAAMPVEQRAPCLARLIDGAAEPGGRPPAKRRKKKKRADDEPATSRAVDAQVLWDQGLVKDPDREIEGFDGEPIMVPGKVWMEAAVRIIRTTTRIDDLRADTEQEVVHDLEVTSGGRRAVVRGVADGELGHLTAWLARVLGGWGTRVARAPGNLTGQVIEAAIRAHAAEHEPEVRTALGRTGWLVVDGEPVYAHAGGAIGPAGHTDAVSAQLDAPYRYINLPDPAAHADTLTADVAASLAVRAWLSDPTTWIALIGSMALAAAGVKPSMLLFLVGPHGSGKTWIVATACSHLSPAYGPKGALMVSFDATTGAIGDAGRGVHHCLLWVDDFRRRNSERARQAQEEGLDRLTRRSYGGGAGRPRNRWLSESGRTETILPDMACPLVVVTGEETPRATDVGSSVERMLSVAVDATTMKAGAAGEMAALARSGGPQRAWAGFIRWMAQQITALNEDPTVALAAWIATQDQARNLAEADLRKRHPSLTPRQAEVAAGPIVGWGLWVDFAISVGALTEAEAAEAMRDGRDRLALAAARHSAVNRPRFDAASFLVEDAGHVEEVSE